jgi:hypothetical protein
MSLDLLVCSAPEFYQLGRDLAHSGVRFRLNLYGRSMLPFIRNGDLVEVAPVSINEVQIGDVVFYRSGSRLVAHRVVGFLSDGEENYFVTRGDGLIHEDRLANEKDLIGRVETVQRQRAIRLERGLYGLMGRLVARRRSVHRCLRLGVRVCLGCESLMRGAFPHA